MKFHIPTTSTFTVHVYYLSEGNQYLIFFISEMNFKNVSPFLD